MNKPSHIKTVVVHLGPHKTGSSAIQQSLASGAKELAQSDVHFLHNADTHAAALDLANNRHDRAEERLGEMSQAIAELPESCVILSQEDFCGQLIGRTRKRRVYPTLTKHLRIIRRALRPHHVRFIFFARDETEWLRSCYHQHLKFRTRFFRFEDFAAHYGENFSWQDRLQKTLEAFGESFCVRAYSPEPTAGILGLLNEANVSDATQSMFNTQSRINLSPSSDQIAKLERINETSEFTATAWFAKSLVKEGTAAQKTVCDPYTPAVWPPTIPDCHPQALPALLARARTRVQRQTVDDILPPADVDLAHLAEEQLPKDVEMPDLTRADIRHQSLILNYHLRGKTKLSHLNALVISYLRRDTEHTGKARVLFHRIWREQGAGLINQLSTRWLISTLQTFLDHGENEAQRMIGTTGYFYGNMMKIYEGERAIEGLEPDASYDSQKPQTKSKFRGLDRYHVGGSDLMLNTNALALEIAQRDPVAGLVLTEFLLRVKAGETVFSRHDRTRKSQGINVSGFENTWAFFDPWN